MSEKLPAAVELGSLGGKARARKLSPKKRSLIARNAALKRWLKNKSKILLDKKS